MSQPLPLVFPLRLQNVEKYASAYKKCLDLESDIGQDVTFDHEPEKANVFCRILGYLIHHAPSDTARSYVVTEIVSCVDQIALLDLGKWYFEHYIRLCV